MPEELVILSFNASDYTPAQSWGLVTWCKRHGADEFTVAIFSFGEAAQPQQLQQFDTSLAPYRVATSERRQLTARSGGMTPNTFIQPTDLWRLTTASLTALQEFLTEGLFTYAISQPEGWFEDRAFYRNGDFMLGVVSHEQEGIVRVTKSEAETLREMGLPFRPHGTYVGY